MLYPVWTSITYTVKFEAGGGSGSMSSQTLTYDKLEKLTPNTFTAPYGQTFAGRLQLMAL